MSNIQEQVVGVSLIFFSVIVVVVFIFICKCANVGQKHIILLFLLSLEYRVETYPLEVRIYSGNLLGPN